jgi:hypothetical protein
MDVLKQLQDRAKANEAEISRLRERLSALELDQHNLGIAMDVLAKLASRGGDARVPSAQTTRSTSSETRQSTSPVTDDSAKTSIRQLILHELRSFGGALTKMDVVSRLHGAGHLVNSSTVGSTLSKLVDAGLLQKSGHSAYRIKPGRGGQDDEL